MFWFANRLNDPSLLWSDLWNRRQNSDRWKVFRYNNLVHNTLTVNGQLQHAEGYAPLTGSYDQADMMNATVDLSQIYQGRLKNASRGIAIVDRQYVAVRDEVETLAEETVIRWTMLTAAKVKTTGIKLFYLLGDGLKDLLLPLLQ